MIRLPKIVTIRVAPAEHRAGWLTLRCLGGRAKWTEESRTLSLKADVPDEETHDKWLDFFASKPCSFRMEVDWQLNDSSNKISTSCFAKCRDAALELRSATVRPKGASSTRYYLKTIAEPSAPPNGGPATQPGNSGVTEGPPSVS
jgi:hypothetical protein